MKIIFANYPFYYFATSYFIKPFTFSLFVFSMLMSIPIIAISSVIGLFSQKLACDFFNCYSYHVMQQSFIYWISITVNIRVKLPKRKKVSGKPLTIIVSNHCFVVDSVIIAQILKEKSKHLKFIYKDSLSYIPIIRQILCYLQYLKTNRTSLNFYSTCTKYFRRLLGNNYSSRNHFFVIYPEGTRFTETKHKESVIYCQSNNINIFNNLICPRYKGFECICKVINDMNIEASILDIAITYLHGKPTLMNCIFGNSRVYAQIEYSYKKVPKSSEAKKFLFDLFYKKDKIIGKAKSLVLNK